ncbi:MAG: hypothetical protein BMS9Abin34_080 [Patescibacteria group bacterium]|nr:MAG: hypothetical protein BMS9Abin34_080 [Patescibacteria group bacterium]
MSNQIFTPVVTQEDHLCGKCQALIPKGTRAYETRVGTSALTKYGRERPIVVKVRYCTSCRPKG